MQRRLTLAILGTVAASLILSGLVTLALTRLGGREQATEELSQQSEAIAAVLRLAGDAIQGNVPLRTQLEAVQDRLRIEDVEIVVIQPNGELMASLESELPPGVELDDLEPASLSVGRTVTGQSEGLIFAATAINPTNPAAAAAGTAQTNDPLVVVVLTGDPDQALGPASRWFVLAAAATMAVAAIVALTLGRRLTRPLVQATAATRRIAAGDLDARVPVPATGADELVELASSINEMAGALKRSRGLERQFLLSISHDLRTPLTSIRGYAESVADGTNTDAAQAAGVIVSEAARLERLVRDLLDLAKLDAHRFGLVIGPCDVTEVVVDTAEGFRPEAEAAGVALVINGNSAGDGAPVVALADPDRLAQVVANLTENALKYAHGNVTLDVTPVDGSVAISVTDDGAGIAPDDLDHVFERLYVASRAPIRKESGSGLGLAIVWELVDAMGGSVAAEAFEPHGTRMIVTLTSSANGAREDTYRQGDQ